ncbi:MAG: ABC transporter permease [Treponema sp.]|nr:ABC transporter permease [Treponema sp.]
MNKNKTMLNTVEEWTIRPNPFRQFVSAYGGIIIVLIAMFMLTAVLKPTFLRPTNLRGILTNSNDVFLAGFGMTFVILAAGIDLSQGSLSAMSGMIVAMLLLHGANFILAITITIAVGALCGALNGALISVFKVPPFVVTLGTMGIFRGLAMTLNAGYSVAINMDNPIIQLANGKIGVIPNVIIIIIAAYLLCYLILHKMNIGRDIYAIGGNKEAARLSGISVIKTSIFAYATCSALVALAGIVLAGRMYSGLPSASTGLETRAVAAVILGGTSFTGGDGKIFGTIIGVLIMGVMLNAMVLFGLSSDTQEIVQGIIIIVAVIYDGLRKKTS